MAWRHVSENHQKQIHKAPLDILTIKNYILRGGKNKRSPDSTGARNIVSKWIFQAICRSRH